MIQDADEETKEILAEAIERGVSRALVNVAQAVVEMLRRDRKRAEGFGVGRPSSQNEGDEKIIEANE